MSDIRQTIQDFYKVAQARDFARKYQFRILDVSNKGQSVFDQDELVYATAAVLPGKTITPQEVPYNGFPFRVPSTVTYNNSDAYNITFYADSQVLTRTRVEDWMKEVFDDETTTGDGVIHNDSTITLVQLNNNFDVVKTYKLFGVFPVQAGDLEYDITATGEVVTFQASFAYQFFRRDNELDIPVNRIGKLS